MVICSHCWTFLLRINLGINRSNKLTTWRLNQIDRSRQVIFPRKPTQFSRRSSYHCHVMLGKPRPSTFNIINRNRDSGKTRNTRSSLLLKAAIHIRKTINFLKLCFCRRKLLETQNVAEHNESTMNLLIVVWPNVAKFNHRFLYHIQPSWDVRSYASFYK